MITPGFQADLVALDADPTAVAPDRLRDLRVRLTMRRGEVVHAADPRGSP